MLAQKIEDDFKAALKAQDKIKMETLRMLKAALGNFLIEKRKDKVEEAELVTLIQKQVKLRQDSIEGFKKGGRNDLVDKETREKTILESYLPKALSEEEVQSLVKRAIQKTGAKSKTDLGKVMKEALGEAQGRVDGKRVSQIASGLLP